LKHPAEDFEAWIELVDDRHPQEQGLKHNTAGRQSGGSAVDDRHPQEQGLKHRTEGAQQALGARSTTVIHKNKD